MVIHSIPPPNPDEHLMLEKSRREAAQRDAGKGLAGKGHGLMTTGDKIIFSIVGLGTLAMMWFFFSWVFGA